MQNKFLSGLILWLSLLLVWWDAVTCEVVLGADKSGPALKVYQERHRTRHYQLINDLEKLAETCVEKGQTEAADVIRLRANSQATKQLAQLKLPKQFQGEVPRDLPMEERAWQTQLRFLENDYANDVYALSRNALKGGFPGFAYQLVREVAWHNPDHANARKLLGYVRQGTEWMTPFAAQMVAKRFEWHDQFGWLPKTHVERYKKGERFANGRWVSIAKEAELRSDFKHAWEVKTDHYIVKTNHSLEKGVELALALEGFYEFFREIFVGYFTTPEQLQKLFVDSAASNRLPVQQYTVHYYKTRQEYNDRLRKYIPQIERTNGLYLTDERIAHFFNDPDRDDKATLFHEATHQQFYESGPPRRDVAFGAHFWLIEGIACYMESLVLTVDGASVGDPDFVRFNNARKWLLVENHYLPFAEFTQMGMREFQAHPKLAANYSQAAGLAHFFMHYEDGLYRETLVQHLTELYSTNLKVRDNARSMSQLLGIPPQTLDRQYREHWESAILEKQEER